MFTSLIVGIIGIIGLMIIWVVVQSYWRDTFFENILDDDVLAGRTSCGNCGCTRICKQSEELIEQKLK